MVSISDAGFAHGVGLFETLRVYYGRPFRAELHVARLISSARTLGWSACPTAESLLDHITTVAQAAEEPDLRVRLTVTPGSIRSRSEDDTSLPHTIVATASPGGSYPAEIYAAGTTAVISTFHQNRSDPTVGHKTTSYFARFAALRAAHASGALESLWFTADRRLAEGSISNVFLVTGGAVRTPSLDTPVLPGITRAIVIDLARKAGIEVIEGALSLEDLLEADEVFLTNSMMELLPVVRIERELVGDDRPGEITQRLWGDYRELVVSECGDGA
jgi:branched-chain amino acid aminotransferase